ncbi:MAG: YezD family protein [Acidobacteria bacterium]|nr:YezD family protein [Acidobacteriota bacterium]
MSDTHGNRGLPPSSGAGITATERAVLEAIRGLRYGSVEVVVHDSRVVQIERREKVRLPPQLPGRRSNSTPALREKP